MSERTSRVPRLAALICLTAHLSGCGTVLMATSTSAVGDSVLENACNITRYSLCSRIPHVYAGAAYDACTVSWAFKAIPFGLRTDPGPTLALAPAFLGFVGIMALDLPVSAAVDTLLLPISITEQSERGDACPVGWTSIPPYSRNTQTPKEASPERADPSPSSEPPKR